MRGTVRQHDRRGRNAQLATVAIAGAIGAVVIALAEHYRSDLDAWVRADRLVRVRLIMGVLTVLTSGPLLAMAVYCWRLGASRGAILRVVAIFSAASAVLLAAVLWRLLFLLEQGTP